MSRRRIHRTTFTAATAELEPALRAYARNLVGDWHSEEGAGAVPPRVLANPLVRRAFGLEPLRAGGPEIDYDPDPSDGDYDERAGGASVARRRLAADRERIGEHWARHGTREPVPWADAHVGRGLRLVGRTLGLGRLEVEVLQLVVALSVSGALTGLVANLRMVQREDLVALVATATARRRGDVRARLSPLAPLFATGLVSVDPDVRGYPGFAATADPRLVTLVLERGLRREKLLSGFLEAEPAPVLALDDFDHLRRELEAVRRVLSGALASRAPGVNVLFHGPTGVGKTEVVRILAAAVGADLFAAGAADGEGAALSPRQRVASLRVGHRLLASARALMVFDELEDLTQTAPWELGEGRGLNKLYFNRLLEESAVPTFWVTNSLAAVDPAHVRRMTFVVRFPSLGAAQRRKVWARVAGGALPDAELDERAAAYDVSPGEIASAVRAARTAGGGTLDADALDRMLAGAMRVMGRRPAPAVRAGAEYRPESVHASTDLVRLADRIAAWTPGARAGISLCLFGPSGTGKSEFAHWLARRTGRPLVARGVSDLESMWVGETEKNLARAFEEAEQQGAILLLDEVDWALADRRGARFAWETTRVAELLQQLEAFRGIVVCTTNLFTGLDQAVLRRFSFKVEFYPLKADQALAMWDAHLARFLPPADADARAGIAAGLRRVGDLTPGDFAAVARRAALLAGEWTPEGLLRELAAEVAARGHEGRPIGF